MARTLLYSTEVKCVSCAYSFTLTREVEWQRGQTKIFYRWECRMPGLVPNSTSFTARAQPCAHWSARLPISPQRTFRFYWLGKAVRVRKSRLLKFTGSPGTGMSRL